jgi:hypothetical protein
VNILWNVQLQLTRVQTLQPAVFIRGVNEDFQFVVEFFDLLRMKGTTGEKISEFVTSFNKYKLPWEK